MSDGKTYSAILRTTNEERKLSNLITDRRNWIGYFMRTLQELMNGNTVRGRKMFQKTEGIWEKRYMEKPRD